MTSCSADSNTRHYNIYLKDFWDVSSPQFYMCPDILLKPIVCNPTRGVCRFRRDFITRPPFVSYPQTPSFTVFFFFFVYIGLFPETRSAGSDPFIFTNRVTQLYFSVGIPSSRSYIQDIHRKCTER